MHSTYATGGDKSHVYILEIAIQSVSCKSISKEQVFIKLMLVIMDLSIKKICWVVKFYYY
jgi:hypothetical protein